jgi:hypothetical protein
MKTSTTLLVVGGVGIVGYLVWRWKAEKDASVVSVSPGTGSGSKSSGYGYGGVADIIAASGGALTGVIDALWGTSEEEAIDHEDGGIDDMAWWE